MNWKNYVEKQNAKTFVLPQGWDTKETIAEQLDCSVEKVDDHLRPALKSGAVIKQQFKVWDGVLGRNVMVWAYQEAAKAEVATTPKQPLSIKDIKSMKALGKTWQEMGAVLGRSSESVRAFYRVNK